jgi:hypothetical protein
VTKLGGQATSNHPGPEIPRLPERCSASNWQQVVKRVPVGDHVIDFAAKLARATRPMDPSAPDFIREMVGLGAGPRAGISLITAAKAHAVLRGRFHATTGAVATPVLRQYIEETNLRAMIAVDVSGSMNYTGESAASIHGKPLSKLDYAKHLAAALSYLFIKQGDRAGLITFDKATRGFVRSGSRPSQVLRILEELHTTAAGEDTDVAAVLHQVAERIPRRGLVILISDLFDDPEKIVESSHHFDFRNHEHVVFHLLANEELTFPFKKFQRFNDLEGIQPMLRIDPQAIRAAYLDRLRAFVKHIDAAWMYDTYLGKQGEDGSWNSREAGRIYGTAMMTLAFTVPYRQLPIYQRDETVDEAD